MDTCSTEIITLIFEYACHDDFGQTARKLGLVSKHFRAIAEPIELRSIAVWGLSQLRATIERLERNGRAEEHIRHLFISELKFGYPSATDSSVLHATRDRTVFYIHASYWTTKESGYGANAFYPSPQHSEDFWKMAGRLIQNSSRTLKTLYLLASENWMPDEYRHGFEHRVTRPKVLGALSDGAFPNLTSLTVNHAARAEMNWAEQNSLQIQTPSIPALRKLQIISPACILPKTSNVSLATRIHPLLSLSRLESTKLSELVIDDSEMWDVDSLLKAIFGDDLKVMQEKRTLPKKLRSVVLRKGMIPNFRNGNKHRNCFMRVRAFVDAVERLGITGLNACYPTSAYKKAGDRDYELLFAQWREDVLSSLD